MGFLTKHLGPSKLEENFKKAISLKWELKIALINNAEVQLNQTTIKKSNNLTNFYFNFEEKELLIEGNLFEDIINSNYFKVVRINNQSDKLEIYLSLSDELDVIFMKCSVHRKYILFEGTLSNWNCRVVDNNILLTINNSIL
jgi:hypothetical protein